VSAAAGAGKRVRLLWLIDSLNVGGAESLIVPFVRRLDRAKCEVSICCLTTIGGNAIEPLLRNEGVAIVNLGARNLRDLGAFRRLLRLVREERIDLIHAHLTYAAIWAAVCSRLTGVPSIASLHVAPPGGKSKEASRDRLMRFVLNRWAASVIAVSDALRDDYLRGGGLMPEKIVAVQNGIELDRFRKDRDQCRQRITSEFGIPADAPLAVTVSVLRPGKGVEVLLDAVKPVLQRVPNAYFLIIGDGSMRAEWAQLAERNGVSHRIRWAGYRKDVESLLAGCDLLVHPSLADAFPTVLLEAMAAGLPIVATNVGGIPEIVEPGVTGRLVPAGDAEALATEVANLLQDSGMRRAMSEKAREVAMDRFSTEAWIRRLETVYQRAVQTPKA
jgi:glycosyltransferase involved in cell wall biosynthesis